MSTHRGQYPLVADAPKHHRPPARVAPWLKRAVLDYAHLPDDQVARILGVQQQHVKLSREALSD